MLKLREREVSEREWKCADVLPGAICFLVGVPEQIPRMHQYNAVRGKLLDGIKSAHMRAQNLFEVFSQQSLAKIPQAPKKARKMAVV